MGEGWSFIVPKTIHLSLSRSSLSLSLSLLSFSLSLRAALYIRFLLKRCVTLKDGRTLKVASIRVALCRFTHLRTILIMLQNSSQMHHHYCEKGHNSWQNGLCLRRNVHNLYVPCDMTLWAAAIKVNLATNNVLFDMDAIYHSSYVKLYFNALLLH